MRKENGCKDLSRVLAVRREKYIARERSGRVNRYRPTREVGAHAPEKLTWGICTQRAGKLYKARSRLYRKHIFEENMRWKALAEIYTMHSFAPLLEPLSNLKIFVKIC